MHEVTKSSQIKQCDLPCVVLQSNPPTNSFLKRIETSPVQSVIIHHFESDYLSTVLADVLQASLKSHTQKSCQQQWKIFVCPDALKN